MSLKQNQELHPTYVDDVKVKISENYKPPPRISLPMSSSQRLWLNTQIQDTIPNYQFTFESTVKNKMKEWRSVRNAMVEERRKRLDILREIREKEKFTSHDLKSELGATNEENLNNTKQTHEEVSTYQSSRDLLIPTQVATTYTNILTPTPLSNIHTQNYICKTGDKSPFNISDFEADTSSPFDNMELKTINDMAELALVLQSDDKNVISKRYSYESIGNASYSHTYANYIKQDTGQNQQYSYKSQPETSTSAYLQPSNSIYTASNGYYYDTCQATASYAYPYSYENIKSEYGKICKVLTPQSEENKLPLNNVPNIMKALETELYNAHLDNKKTQDHTVNIPKDVPISAKHTEFDKMEKVYENLPVNLQVLSKNISGMGFPLERVAQVCKLLGDDNKKVIEHLLAMSELLDLGFREDQVSNALIQCNNDRDKALDLLIL